MVVESLHVAVQAQDVGDELAKRRSGLKVGNVVGPANAGIVN